MDHLVHSLQADYPQFVFLQSKTACWSPRDKHIHYTTHGPHSKAKLLHELAHALLGHTTYQSDLDLLRKEIEAWEQAQILAERYEAAIDPEHAQDCLDTYRDWVHKRSTCPTCHMNGLQSDVRSYRCLNCGHTWEVSSSRFCRPYRRSNGTKKDRNDVPALSRFV